MSSRTLQIEKVTSLLEEAYAIRVNNLQKSVALTNEALAIARELSDAALTGKCLNQISLFYMNLGENQLSMEASREAIQHFTELNDEMGIADAKFNIASVSYKSDDYHAGLTNLVEALAIYRKHNAYGKESRTCKALGTIYEFFGDAKNALTSYHRAVDAAKKVGDLNLESNAYNPMSGIYLDQGNVQKAMEYIEDSIRLKTQTGDIRGMAFALYGRGKIYTFTRQFAEAEKDFKEAERIHIEMGEKLGLAMNCYKKGGMYFAMGRLEDALKSLTEGHSLSVKHGIAQFRHKCAFLLYKVYKQLADIPNALKFLEEHLTVKDAVINIEALKIIENYELISRQQLRENKELKEAKEYAEEQNRKLLQANAELDQFVYRASHDLRAPISSIMGLADIGMNAESIEEARRCFELINRRVKAQDYFIRQIVDNASNARLAVEHEEIPVRELIDDVIQSLFFMEGIHQVRFELNVDETLRINSDHSRLKTIINNLISNSVFFRDNTKSESFIRITFEKENHQGTLMVEDNGEGIFDDRKDKIFNMFYRGNERSTGSGLGLFIVKGMVEKLGGEISFDSQHGVGSKFRVVIPLR